MSKRKKPLPPRPPPKRTSPAPGAAAAAEKRPPEDADSSDSSPDIRVAYGPAGRETMAAIAEDVARAAFPPEPVSKVTRAIIPPQTSSPDLSFELAPAGRETLSAIVGEAKQHAPTDVRAPMTTIDYDEPIDRRKSGPEIVLKEMSPGREALAAIENEPASGALAPGRKRVSTRGYADPTAQPEVQAVRVGRDTLEALARAVGPESAPTSGVHAALEVFEMVTFVIRGDDLAALSSETMRRRFVEERLLRRLPVRDMAHVDRIDVTPWTVKNTVVLRVWCRLPAD
ncbi:MAG TPA: hypothetical protein PKA88_20965 [Polyangiaceae bacterium]|nr:hypothetical protein [Polyangiaceae bacterium]